MPRSSEHTQAGTGGSAPANVRAAVLRAAELVRLREHAAEPGGADGRAGLHEAVVAALREYALLRDELWNALRANAPVSTNPDEVFEVERAINATFDAIVNAAAAAFAEEPPPPRANDELP